MNLPVDHCRFMSMSRPVKNSLFYFKDPSINKPAENDSSETARWSQFAYEQNINIKAHWEELFLDELGPIPDILQSPNCGQFAVTKDRVRARSKEFWQVCELRFSWHHNQQCCKTEKRQGMSALLFYFSVTATINSCS